jgi:predicted  nucleic acid-binding Zn-ribbon protein
MIQELHRSIQRLGESEHHHRERLEALERRLEPWATDADLAFHCFDEVKDASRKLRGHIQGTTASISKQVAQLTELTGHLGESAARIPPPPPPASSHELPAPLPPLKDSA